MRLPDTAAFVQIWNLEQWLGVRLPAEPTAKIIVCKYQLMAVR